MPKVSDEKTSENGRCGASPLPKHVDDSQAAVGQLQRMGKVQVFLGVVEHAAVSEQVVDHEEIINAKKFDEEISVGLKFLNFSRFLSFEEEKRDERQKAQTGDGEPQRIRNALEESKPKTRHWRLGLGDDRDDSVVEFHHKFELK